MNLYIYARIFPPNLESIQSEGTKKAVHGLACGLVAYGAKVTILCEGDSDGLFAMSEGYSIRCFANPNQGQKFNVPLGLKRFIREYLDCNSLVILNGIFQPKLYSLSSFLKKCDVPYVIAPHDPYNPAIFSKNYHLKLPYWYLFERKVLQQAKAVQVLDIRHAEYLRDLNIQTPVIAVPNGFSPTDLQPVETLEWNASFIPKLLFLGRIDAHNKGLDLLLEAFAQLAKTVDAKLTFQGRDQGDRKALKEQASKLSLSDRTSFLEPDYATATPIIIQDFDIFCLPSRFEGFGLSALEAMLAGRVLLVSEVAGIAPHVQASGCGVVVAPEVAAIKSGLMELFDRRSKWKEMGLRGRDYALEHLRWDSIAADALKQYKQLVN